MPSALRAQPRLLLSLPLWRNRVAVRKVGPVGWQRYVALGDSTTEGLNDHRPDGLGYRGWADRLAEQLAVVEPDLMYANLAVRGKLARQVRETQLDPALALEPDLASVVAGLNDTLRRECDLDVIAGEIETMIAALRESGADVLTVTFPDPVPINPMAGTAALRLKRLNESIRQIADRHGAYLADLERHAVSSDPRLWSGDRLHANPLGHERLAAAGAEALGLPGADSSWTTPLPVVTPPRRAARVSSNVVWTARYMTPWVIRRIRGRSSGDGRVAKRPDFAPVRGEQDPLRTR